MSHLWIMVADAAAARIYATSERGEALLLIESIEHPQGRLRDQDLVTARPGSNSSDTSPRRHAFEPHTPAGDVELDHYAQHLAARLEQGRVQNAFDGLMLAMPPRLLGRVKAALSPETERLLQQSLDQRLIELSAEELRAYLTPI